MPSKETILSILVPAFDYELGILRILEAAAENDETLEIIIYDDSETTEVRRGVESYQAQYKNIIYQNNKDRHGQNLGAVENWNALLSAATGKYVMLMHHDEFPCDGRILKNVSDLVDTNPSADAFLLGLSILDQNGKKKATHAPYWFRYFISTRFPGYLFRRNVVGPTGTLLIRRCVLPRFLPDLVWLVDVEFYYRLFTSGVVIGRCPQIVIGSVQGTSRSITESLAPNIANIRENELTILANRYQRASLWLSPAASRIIGPLELISWLGWRATSKLYCFIERALVN